MSLTRAVLALLMLWGLALGQTYPDMPSNLVVNAPVVALTLPNVVGGSENGTVDWTATCSNATDSIASAQLVVNGTPVGTADTSSPYSGAYVSGYAVDTAVTVAVRCTAEDASFTDSAGQSIDVDVTAPSAIANLAGVAIESNKVRVRWDVATDATSALAPYPVLYCQPAPCTPTQQTTSIGEAITLSSLTTGVSYDIQINAVDTVGNAATLPTKVTVPMGALVAYYPLEGTTDDLSITNNDGTLTGTTTYESGRIGEGLDTDGSTGWMTAPWNAAYNTTAFSVSFWVDCQNGCTTGRRFVTIDDGVTDRRWAFRTNQTVNTTIDFYVLVSGTLRNVTASAGWTTTGFRHVVGTYDGTTIRLYIDGVERGSAAWTGTVGAGTAQNLFSIGASSIGTAPANAIFDEVRMHNIALGANRINALYGLN